MHFAFFLSLQPYVFRKEGRKEQYGCVPTLLANHQDHFRKRYDAVLFAYVLRRGKGHRERAVLGGGYLLSLPECLLLWSLSPPLEKWGEIVRVYLMLSLSPQDGGLLLELALCGVTIS